MGHRPQCTRQALTTARKRQVFADEAQRLRGYYGSHVTVRGESAAVTGQAGAGAGGVAAARAQVAGRYYALIDNAMTSTATRVLNLRAVGLV